MRACSGRSPLVAANPSAVIELGGGRGIWMLSVGEVNVKSTRCWARRPRLRASAGRGTAVGEAPWARFGGVGRGNLSVLAAFRVWCGVMQRAANIQCPAVGLVHDSSQGVASLDSPAATT
jgi:hypothetical protein